ncbi:hypothetical protein L596_002462 [Steinernema carpocapsae]|uniref:Uncharacterized protein n=1 Tax=Steinernema carpocapsae TaxID=34508 RepID=A0A4U8UPK7_STECR|nr:hypothetical protein L596_002462 [Steinernema carpocapsae]
MNSPYTSSKLRSAPPLLIPDASNGDSPPSKQARECSPEANIETVMNAISVNYSPLKTALDNSFDNISVLSTIEEEDQESSPEPATTSRKDLRSSCVALAKNGNGAASLRFREQLSAPVISLFPWDATRLEPRIRDASLYH